MKRMITGIVLSTAVFASPAGFIHAHAGHDHAPPVKKVVTQVATKKLAVTIDGKEVVLSTVLVNGKNLINVRELTQALGITTNWNTKTNAVELTKDSLLVTFTSTSKELKAKDHFVQMVVPPRNVNGSMFIELAAVVQSFGGDIAYDATTKRVSVSTVPLLSGSVDAARWVNADTVLVTIATEEGKMDYAVNVKTKKYETVLGADQAVAELVVSPDGKHAVYVNDSNQLFLVDLATKQATALGEDKAYKADIQWAQDGSKIYFLHSEKTNVVASITIADGKLTKLVDDKVNYKADLRVSEDGKALLYAVTKDGKITADAPKEDDEASVENAKVEIDLKGTEPQLFVVDTTATEAKAVAITADTDNKVFATILKDGRIAYVSASQEEGKTPVLKVVGKDGKNAKDLVADMDIHQIAVANDGRLLMLAADKAGKVAIYEVDATSGTKKKMVDVSADTTQMYVSQDGKQIAVSVSTEMGEQIAVLAGNAFVNITK